MGVKQVTVWGLQGDGRMKSICNYHPQPLTKGDEFEVHCRHPQADWLH